MYTYSDVQWMAGNDGAIGVTGFQYGTAPGSAVRLALTPIDRRGLVSFGIDRRLSRRCSSLRQSPHRLVNSRPNIQPIVFFHTKLGYRLSVYYASLTQLHIHSEFFMPEDTNFVGISFREPLLSEISRSGNELGKKIKKKGYVDTNIHRVRFK